MGYYSPSILIIGTPLRIRWRQDWCLAYVCQQRLILAYILLNYTSTLHGYGDIEPLIFCGHDVELFGSSGVIA